MTEVLILVLIVVIFVSCLHYFTDCQSLKHLLNESTSVYQNERLFEVVHIGIFT
jgi:hypothetical protein